MHIPDGFLDTRTWVGLDVISACILYFSISRLNKKMSEKHIPLMGVIGAFVFAAQMINFPVVGGTSGHFMGSALIAILLGPFSAILIMSTVLIIQCFIFQDGGLLALGANIFNMGVVGVLSGFYIYLFFNKLFGEKNTMFISGFIAGLFAIVLSASACAIELAMSNTVPFKIVLPAMAGVHFFIGIVEGLITIAVLSFIKKIRPDLLKLEKI